MENIFEYIKSALAAVMSFFVMISGMLGINSAKPEADIPEMASGTLTAESLGLPDDAEPVATPVEHETLKASPGSVSESGLLTFGIETRGLPSNYSETDNKVYKAVGFSFEEVDPIRLRAGVLPTVATQSLDRLAAAGYIQSRQKSGKTSYKRIPEDLFIADSALSGEFIFACGEGKRQAGDNDETTPGSAFIAKHSAEGGLVKCVEIANVGTDIHFTGIAPAPGGGAAVCGFSTAGSPNGTQYAFITIYTSEIEEVKTIKVYGEGKDSFSCIAATSDGGFVAGGKTTSTTHDFDGIPDFGHSVSVIMKFDSEGRKKWTRYLGGSGVSEVVDIDADSSGGIFADISAIPNDGDFANFSGLIKGSLDNVIIKYDSNGLMKWNYVLSSNGRDYFDYVCADGNGGCVAGGSFSLTSGNSTVTMGTLKGVNVSGGSDIYVAAINSLGVKIWGRLLRGISNDRLGSIAKVKNGYVLTGYSESDNGEFIQNTGGYDAFADFINSSGEQIEIFHKGGAGRDIASSAVSSGNRVYVFGDSDSELESGLTYSEYFVGVYDIS